MLTIKTKIVMSSTLVFGLTLAGFAFLVYQSSQQAELAKLDARLESHCEKIEAEIEEQLTEGTFPDSLELIDFSTEGLSNVLVQIWDSSGQLVVPDSILQYLEGSKWQSRYVVSAETGNLIGRNESFRCRWFPVEIDERVPLVLEVAAPLSGVHEILAHLRGLFLVSIPVAMIVIALAAYFFTRAAFLPLTGMAKAAQNISANNLDERLTVPAANDEVRSLAVTLNHMIERIEAAFRSQRQFVADASHEIRTPLSIINSELEYAQKADTNPVVRESIGISLSEIDRLSKMAESLLLLAKLDSAQTNAESAIFRLDELVVETVQLMRRLANSKNLNIDLYVQEAVEIMANHDMIKRAILNVLENALKYSQPNDLVSVSLRIDNQKLDRATLEISDNGPGISEGDQAKVFERFYRSPNARPESNGSGLGLSIARKLVELNSGTIFLWSVIGQGTKITIELPKYHSD